MFAEDFPTLKQLVEVGLLFRMQDVPQGDLEEADEESESLLGEPEPKAAKKAKTMSAKKKLKKKPVQRLQLSGELTKTSSLTTQRRRGSASWCPWIASPEG